MIKTLIVDTETGELIKEHETNEVPYINYKKKIKEVFIDIGTENRRGLYNFLQRRRHIDNFGKIKIHTKKNIENIIEFLDSVEYKQHVIKIFCNVDKTYNRLGLTNRSPVRTLDDFSEMLGIKKRQTCTIVKYLMDMDIIRKFNKYYYVNPLFYTKNLYLDIATIFCFKDVLEKEDMIPDFVTELIKLYEDEEDFRRERFRIKTDISKQRNLEQYNYNMED